ncbi:hsp90-like protein [Colletotrichum graminicola]|uniref:Hsp90-like protein n=1 Tax=Colletotrichum graminicola (strain M1.001 / M2 / FGSC 10212) TaxID=645133 RepID=E3QXY9_COLGM|nr:hsp90-like protein [Colletotrichum graminicola M1.001]EFQ35727.1 hsp90-like protein [Colletotrichum graminicola M1.001]WDK10332.1 hsp90-like protein [Colletotrichum graminicola]
MSEAQREREVQRYLQSWEVAQGSSLNVALNVDSLAAPDLHGNGYKPKPSPDKALTAFAQLAVLRLNVRRAMVSLIDSTTQTILAESTRALQLGDLNELQDHQSDGLNSDEDRSTGPSADLWLGAAILSRPDAVCEHSLVNTCTGLDHRGKPYTATGLIVNDCRFDSRFCNRPYVLSEPGVRFYAGVPIISRSGHKIGSFAVSDEVPHDGLTADEIRFMQGLAQTVMEHLEWARDRVDRFKGERIVRGLATFVEGCSVLAEDQTTTKDEVPRSPSTVRPPDMALISNRRPMPRSNSYFRHAETKSRSRESSASRQQTEPVSPPSEMPPSTKKGPQPRADGMSRLFSRAADVLRHSTLADGVALFGATATTDSTPGSRPKSGKTQSSDEEDVARQHTSGSGLDSSDSDTSPSSRPCRILSYSVADERARQRIEQGPALSLGILEKYFAMFPMGKTFSFTEAGVGVSSGDDSASDRETMGVDGAPPIDRSEGRRRKVKMVHEELLKKIPGAKTVVFVPLFDYGEDKLAGGCFLWTSVTGRMMNLDQDLSYLRAFSNSIMTQVGRINSQKNEAAKTTFIASMSHELRSPLHGILGSVELLQDTTTDAYQSGLISSIATCGKTLLDTLNHVLDYSKINRLGRAQMRRRARQNQNRPVAITSDSLESLSMTSVVDMAVLVEEVVDAIAAGHAFKKLVGTGPFDGPPKPSISVNESRNIRSVGNFQPQGQKGVVSVLVDIDPKTPWLVKTQPGALRRIIMNLFGNALKYTSTGFVLVSLSGQVRAGGSKIDAMIRVADSGKGMSEEFQQTRLFLPFSQEDSFQPGTGLGLSIVKQIVDSLRGSLEVRSEQNRGTEIDVHLGFTPVSDEASREPDEAMRSAIEQTRGLQVVLLEGGDGSGSQPKSPPAAKLNGILTETCAEWFHMKVDKEDPADPKEADLYLYSEPPSKEVLEKRFKENSSSALKRRKAPFIIVSPNAEEAVRILEEHSKLLMEFSEIVEVIPQPCGPRKLAKVFTHCLKRAADLEKNGGTSGIPVRSLSTDRQQAEEVERVGTPLHQDAKPAELEPAMSAQPLIKPLGALALSPALNGGQPVLVKQKTVALHVLLVDDNQINLKLLVMFMKKCGFSYEQAENGQEALDRFVAASSASAPASASKRRRFDFVLMDISMPVMNGFEATKRIREYEREHKLQAATVVALTGLASSDARRDAETSGFDVFLPKPVRFAELQKLLTAS